MEVALHNIIDGTDGDLKDRCGALMAMYRAGKKEVPIFLFGLMAYNYGNIARKGIIVESLENYISKGWANILFNELRSIESNNSTRIYIDTILKCINRFPLDIIRKDMETLLNDKKWSYKMKKKFEDILVRKILAV
jgi:hypothetical protein